MDQDTQIIALMVTAVSSLSGVIVHLYLRVNKLNDRIVNLQESFRTEIVGIHEKTLALLPNIEKAVLEHQSDSTEKVIKKVEDEHTETKNVIRGKNV